LKVLFGRSRGDEFLEIRHQGERFSPALLRLLLLGGEPENKPVDIEQDASFLCEHFFAIEQLFSPTKRIDSIRRLHEIRRRQIHCMFPDLVISQMENKGGKTKGVRVRRRKPEESRE
jgi:hypothetical protein